MTFNEEEKQLKQKLETIQTPPSSDLQEMVQQRLAKKSSFHFNRPLKVTVALCACLFLSVTVVSASPRLQNLLYMVSSDIIASLQPINMTSESDGIKLEVLGAMNDEEEVIIYLTLQDLTGNRIDETLDIYNYNLSGVSSLNMQTIDYNEETKTATLRLKGNGGKRLNGKTVYLVIQSFLSDKSYLTDIGIELNWDELLTTDTNDITIMFGDNVASGGSGIIAMNTQSINILTPNALSLSIPGIDFMTISNIGYIDNQLHIQTKWRNESIDDHGYFYFIDPSTQEKIIEIGSVSYGVDSENSLEYGDNMKEYIFDVSPQQLKHLQLKGYFVTANNYTEGDWKVKFKLESTADIFTQSVQIANEKATVTEVSLSPQGITLAIDGDVDSNDWDVAVKLKDGSTLHLNSSVTLAIEKEQTIKYCDPSLLDVQNIEAILINNAIISIP